MSLPLYFLFSSSYVIIPRYAGLFGQLPRGEKLSSVSGLLLLQTTFRHSSRAVI